MDNQAIKTYFLIMNLIVSIVAFSALVSADYLPEGSGGFGGGERVLPDEGTGTTGETGATEESSTTDATGTIGDNTGVPIGGSTTLPIGGGGQFAGDTTQPIPTGEDIPFEGGDEYPADEGTKGGLAGALGNLDHGNNIKKACF
jgi:hypothetical protein